VGSRRDSQAEIPTHKYASSEYWQVDGRIGGNTVGGWVKLYRILLDKPIWRQSTPEQKVILITLLLMANHEPCEWEWRGKKFVVQPGQFVTSLPAIRERCGKGISIQNIRTALARFQKLEFLTDKASETGRLINILNWAEYQGLNGEGNSLTNRPNWDNQQSTNRRLTANKNDKNDKNQEEGSIYDPSFESFSDEVTPTERLILHELKTTPSYPFDIARDLQHVRSLFVDYPTVDVLSLIKKWKSWLLEPKHQLKKSSNPRLQLRNWCENEAKWQKKRSERGGQRGKTPEPPRKKGKFDDLILR